MRAVNAVASMVVEREVQNKISAKTGAVWIGANSFEERCLGSLIRLADVGSRLMRVVVVHYSTTAYPEAEDFDLRRMHRESIRQLSTRLGADRMEDADIPAYGAHALLALLRSVIADNQVTSIVLDITCLTKIHIVAIAALLAGEVRHDLDVVVCYTSPVSYGNLNQACREYGWSDVIIAPLGESAVMEHEPHGRGIVIAGHESDRLWAALHELEAPRGTIVFGSVPRRPDITRLSKKLNLRLLKQLLLTADAWTQDVVDLADFDSVEQIVRREVSMASAYKSPVILYPLGPKSLIFAAAQCLARLYEARSWIVYPICAAYDTSYSSGIGGSLWLVDQLPSIER